MSISTIKYDIINFKCLNTAYIDIYDYFLTLINTNYEKTIILNNNNFKYFVYGYLYYNCISFCKLLLHLLIEILPIPIRDKFS